MRLGRAGAPLPPVRLDDNVGTYDAARDGRSGEGRIQDVRLDRIEPSRFQVRLVFDADEIEALADSIAAHGLIHEPRGRPHPDRPGWVELMPGEMRIRAVHRLVQRGAAEGVLRQDGDGHWLVPIRVEATDDEHADAMVFGENYDRTDLSAWEWAVALARRRARMREAGESGSVRDVAASIGRQRHQAVGEYLQVADAMSQELLMGAGLFSTKGVAHARLARLSLAALLRIARRGRQGATAGIQALLNELVRVGDPVAKERLAARADALRPSTALPERGLQLNIRQPLDQVAPEQARRYLRRIAPAVATLARTAGPGAADAASVAAELISAARCLYPGVAGGTE